MNSRCPYLLTGAVALFTLLMIGASDSGQANTSIVEPVPGPIISSFVAKVNSGGLRIRSLPATTGEIISKLDKDDVLRVESRSSWTDTIDGIAAPWFEVSKGWAAGWCFGGYLSTNDKDLIPISDIRKNQTKLVHSYFGGADGKNIGPLPYQNMKIFGVEEPYAIPSRNGFGSAYDDINHVIFLEVRPVPENVLRVRATDPKGNSFTVDLPQSGDPSFQTIDTNEEGFRYSQPVTAVRFRAPASTFGGQWFFDALPDGKVSLKNKFKISVGFASATLSQTDRPSPFYYPATVLAKTGEALFLFGADAAPNAKVKIAFYQLTSQQNTDLSFKMKPVVAGELMSDKSGRYRTILHIGTDMPAGEYKFGHGEDGITINLFDIYLAVQ